MKALFLILIFFLYALFSQAATYYSIASGNWDDVNVWSSTDDIPISQLTSITGHVFYIENGNQINFNGITNPAEIHAVSGQLNSTGSLTGASIKVFIYSGGSINITGNFTTEYIYYRQEINANISISVGGDFTTASLFTHSHNPNFNISASNVIITNYNYHSSNTARQYNIINTTFNVLNTISITNFYPSTQGNIISNKKLNIARFYMKSNTNLVQSFNADVDIAELMKSGFNNTSLKLYMTKFNKFYLRDCDNAVGSTEISFPFSIYGFPEVHFTNGLKTQNAGDLYIQGDFHFSGVLDTQKALGITGYFILSGNSEIVGNAEDRCVAIGGDFIANGYTLNISTLNTILNIFGDANLNIVNFPSLNGQTNIFVSGNATITAFENKTFNGGGKFTVLGSTIIKNHSLTFENNSWSWFGSDGRNNITLESGGNIVFTGAQMPSAGIDNYKQCASFVRDSLIKYTTPFPLPITLQEFKGNLHPNGVELEWTTCSEKNNEYFTIWKSKTISEFIEIGTVQGAGSSIEKNTYTYLDKKPYIGNNYYRLSQTDYDGTTEYFPIIAVHYLDNYKIGVSPTVVPRNGKIKIETDAASFTTKLLNINGIELIHKKSNQQSDIIQLNDNIATGNYILYIQIGNSTLTENIIIY